MPDASAGTPARLGLGAKIFIAATLSVMGVLGVTLGLTSVQAERTADESIRRALAGVRRGVQAFLTGRTVAFTGMSAVSAFDRELQEAVAIKTLRPEALAGGGVALERFKQEIRLARKIAHRNVVRTYDLGEQNGMYYLTMEYVEGTSLKQLIVSRGKLPVAVTLTVGKQICRALEVAHAEGVIHRDIKPQNIVVEPSGFLKVMDFGIARLANPPQGKGLTEAGTSIGTPD